MGIIWATCNFKDRKEAADFVRAIVFGGRSVLGTEGGEIGVGGGGRVFKVLGSSCVLEANTVMHTTTKDPRFASTKCHILLAFDEDNKDDIADMQCVSPAMC
jgi:hypothetical protein